MDVVGKIEIEVQIKSAANNFHQVLWRRPHHLANVSPNIQKVELLEGDWGTLDSVINCHYVIDGNACVAKGIIEAIDEENKLIIFRVMEGDLMNEYKKYKIIIKAIPKQGEGSLVHWSVEYEKQNEDILPPNKMFEFAFRITKDIDDHLVQPHTN